MKAVLKYNAPTAVIFVGLFLLFGLLRVTLPWLAGLAMLILLFASFYYGSFVALHRHAFSFLWALGLTVATVIIAVVAFFAFFGLGFTQI